MRRRLPVLPTLLVALAAAAMVALGLWQLLDRRPKKLALLAQIAANPTLPPIAFPRAPDETLLFRRAQGFCLQPVAMRLEGAGAAGFRVIATCRTGAEGPGLTVQLGTTRDPRARIAWPGGAVTGTIAHAPDSRSMIAAAFDRAPAGLMLVATTPPAGLTANAPPDPAEIANPHLGYAIQWFAFATAAIVIYGAALRARWRRAPAGPPPAGRIG
jgi:surfeit locus 1 family protein